MEQGTSKDKKREFVFTDNDFRFLQKFILESTGIALADSKKELVYGRLAKRLRLHNIDSFSNYCNFLQQENNELPECINAITTNLTAFFRENHHFEYLAGKLIPELISKKTDREIRIWSAGCSTGEEPYSIAITLLENLPSGWTCKILATDLDSNVVSHAQQGVYKIDRLTGIDDRRIRRWFLRGKGDKKEFAKVSPHLQEFIHFKQLNLMHKWPMRMQFDIIFCRNVIIYFSKDTQKVLIDRYADQLVNDGHLFIGHSESLFKITDRFNKVGTTTYRKIK